MSWAGQWLPKAYFGIWFGDATSTLPAAGPPFVWLVAADGRACVLSQDQALAALAAEGWEARLMDFVDQQLLADGWAAALPADLVAVAICDNPTATLPADSFSR